MEKRALLKNLDLDFKTEKHTHTKNECVKTRDYIAFFGEKYYYKQKYVTAYNKYAKLPNMPILSPERIVH